MNNNFETHQKYFRAAQWKNSPKNEENLNHDEAFESFVTYQSLMFWYVMFCGNLTMHELHS